MSSALATAWATSSASPGALPAGVTGTSLFGLSTAAKIAAVNLWTIAPTQPTAALSAQQILGCITSTDFAGFTAVQLQWLQVLLTPFGNGSLVVTNTGPIATLGSQIFAGKTTTLAALTALFNSSLAPAVPWNTAPVSSGGGGLPGPIDSTDLLLAGGLT